MVPQILRAFKWKSPIAAGLHMWSPAWRSAVRGPSADVSTAPEDKVTRLGAPMHEQNGEPRSGQGTATSQGKNYETQKGMARWGGKQQGTQFLKELSSSF